MRARPTKPPTTPPAIGATFVEPFKGSVSPLPWSAVPASGEITPADPAAGILVSVGCESPGCVSGEGSSGSTDCAGAEDTNTGSEAFGTAEDAAGTSANVELVGGAAKGFESELAGAGVADGVGVGSTAVATGGVSSTSGTGTGTAAAGTCCEMLARSDDSVAAEETALLVPIAVETASDDMACCVVSIEVDDAGGGADGGASSIELT
jgi:hypothetical protein